MHDLRICFIGDSYLNGTGDPEGLGWARRLCRQRYSPSQRFTYYELGVRGHTTADIKARWEAECGARLPDGGDNRVVVQFGLNDAAEIVGKGIRVPLDESIDNAEEIVAGISARYPLLWVGFPPANVACSPMKPSPGMVIDFDQDRATKYNLAYKRIAAEQKVDYLDIQTPLLEDTEYMAGLTRGDHMHCDGRGYEIMTEHIQQWPPWEAWFKPLNES